MCVRDWARMQPTRAQMEVACAAIDAPEQGGCRTAWVDERLRVNDTPRGVLLDACGPQAECALQVLDAYPEPEPLAQLAVCSRAGSFEPDCRGHAFQRWALAAPDAAEVARVVAGSPPDDRRLGYFLGLVVACQGTISCPADAGPMASECSQARQKFARSPEDCVVDLPAVKRPR